jgi:peptidoglycan/xylan/chitin deacetylase (PgdA/CDA1 family)
VSLRVVQQPQNYVHPVCCENGIECNPEVGTEPLNHGHDIVSHAYRWIDHIRLSLEEERALIKQEVESIRKVSNVMPKGV